MIEIIETIATLLGLLAKPFRWGIRKARLSMFRIASKRRPLDQLKAREITYSILSGYIVCAVAYRNIDSQHVFISAVRRSSEDQSDNRIYVLEQFGNTYRSIWNSEPFFDLPQFQITDIDGDGIYEVVFTETSFGTGGGSRFMFIYSTTKKQQFQIREFYNWQDAAGPASPQIEVEPDTDKEFIGNIERFAVKQGFLQSKIVDFDKPEFAAQRWHAENGRKTSGAVKLFFTAVGHPALQVFLRL